MIDRIRIHNYRCFENFTLDLTGRKSALIIGKNGTGKSTLREALGVLRGICRSYRAKQLISLDDFPENRAEMPMRFELSVTLGKNQFDYLITFEYSNYSHEVLVFDERLSIDGNAHYWRQRDRLTLPGGATILLNPTTAALAIINEKLGEGTVLQLRAFLRSMILLSPAPGAMHGFAEEESFELEDSASNFAAWLSAALIRQPARYSDILKYLQFMLPDLTSFEFVPRGERGKQLHVVFENENKSRAFPIDFKMLSDGEKCFFLSAVIVAVNRPESPLFCFWDEPENHLPLPEVGHFVTQMRKMTNRGGQFLATSHHPETIRSFTDDSTLVFTRNSHLEPTVVRPLSELNYAGDLIEALIRDEVQKR